MLLYKRMKQLRIFCGMTQAEIASRLHLSREAYSQYENGRRHPSPETLVELASIFGVSVDNLCGVSQKPLERPRKRYSDVLPPPDFVRELGPGFDDDLIFLSKLGRKLKT